MKQKTFSFLLTLLMSMAATVAMAYDVEIDGIYYNLSGDEASVTYQEYQDSSPYYISDYSGDIVIPASVTYNNKTYIVTSIGGSAFDGCASLYSITIPESVTCIGASAFRRCSGLTSITIPNSVTSIGSGAFYKCSGLTSITIPNSVTSIGDEAFYTCSGLTSVTIPNSVTSIGGYAFYGCNGLTSITIPEIVTSIGDSAFEGCSGLTSVTIPNSVTTIGSYAFSGCTSLTSITIPESVTSIESSTFDETPWYNNQPDGLVYAGKVAYKYKGTMLEGTHITIEDGTLGIAAGAFYGCSGLTTITIPNSVITIGNIAFSQCTGLTSVTIGNSVTSIGDYAFSNCTGLTSITIPNSVTSIGNSAFLECSVLTSISIPNSVTSIGCNAFARTPWFYNQPYGLVYAGKVAYGYHGTMPENTKIDIQDGTLGIAEGAFWYCSGLTSVTIPNSVTTIGNWAFSDTGLTSVTIPNSVTSIGYCAFYGCLGLKSVTIPNSVTNIGNSAFSGCSGLTSIKVGMKTPVSINENTFGSSYEGATLYVPKGSKAAYESTYPWSKFKNIIECNVDAEDMNIAAGNSTTMEINVNNFETNIVGFQMDLTLPAGVGIDKTGCSLSSRITDENQELTIGKLEDGTYRLTSTSLSLTPISGNDGTLLTLKLTVEDGCKGGQATISNILFSTSDSEKVIMDDESFDISILYNLTYKVDGEEYKTSSIAYGTLLTPEPNPTKEGYTFSGWSEIPATMPNHDVTVTGSFSINSYTLTYMLDGEVYKTESVVYGTPLEEEPALTKEGYTFSGWNELPETMPAMDVVITGSFTVNSYSLTYIVDDEVYKVLDVDYGTTIVPEPAPQNDGHTFSGWRDLPTTMPANDIVVTGIFSYTLTYKVDGEEYKTFSVFYGTELTLEAEPTKDGYTFGGWSELPTTMPNHDVVVTGAFYLYGDVNTDEEVDVVDVVDVARYVVATPSARFREKLADLNFDNTVNIADAVTLVNYIAGDQNFVKAWAAPSNFTANDALSLTEKNGNLSLILENEHNYTAFQFDLFVPEDIDVTAMMLNTGRKQGHQLLYNKVEDGHYRVAALSISNNDFKGNEGELLKFAMNEVLGNEISIRDIHFFTAEGHDYIFDDIEGAIPTSLSQAFSQNEEDIYDLQGRKRGKMQRGVNIVGGKKVMVKK